MKIKSLINYFSALIISISLFFLSGSAFYIVSSTTTKIIFLFIMFVGIFLYNFHYKLKFTLRLDSSSLFLLFIVLGMSLSQILYWNNNPILEYIMFLFRILLAYYLSKKIKRSVFSKNFCFLMGVIVIVSIFVHFLIQFNIPVPNYTFIGANGLIHHSIGVSTWNEPFNELCGPFWEKGVFCSVMLYTIILESYFTNEKPRKWIIVSMIIGIILSASTAGYLLLFIVIYIWFIKTKKNASFIDLITIVAIIFLIVFSDEILLILNDINPKIFGKIVDQTLSTQTRLNSPLVCLLIFLKNPITGFGRNYAIDIYNSYKVFFRMDSLTSTSAYMLSSFGIFGLSYTWFLFRGVFNQKNFSKLFRILMFLLLFLIVNKEPHTSIFLTYVIMFYLNQKEEFDERYIK